MKTSSIPLTANGVTNAALAVAAQNAAAIVANGATLVAYTGSDEKLADYLSVNLSPEVVGAQAAADLEKELVDLVQKNVEAALKASVLDVQSRLLDKIQARDAEIAAKQTETQATQNALFKKYGGKTLRCLRKKAGLSALDVVQRAKKYGGPSAATYRNMENGFSRTGKMRGTSISFVSALAKVFKVNMSTIAFAIEASYQLHQNNPADPKKGPGRRRRRVNY